jgi:hypothetical protein
MEKSLGRPLADNEHVYHLNSDPLDNRIENLVVIVRNKNKQKPLQLDMVLKI